VAQSLDRALAVAAEARRRNIRVRAYISCALGCPFEGAVPPELAADLARALHAHAPETEIVISDTIGTGTPGEMARVLAHTLAHVPINRIAVHCASARLSAARLGCASRLRLSSAPLACASRKSRSAHARVFFGCLPPACHAHPPTRVTHTRASAVCFAGHDTYGQALANILEAMRHGVATVDSSVAGLGGCPFAGPGAAGNVATEDVVYMLRGAGVETGVNLDAAIDAGAWACEQLGRANASKAAMALLRRREHSAICVPTGATLSLGGTVAADNTAAEGVAATAAAGGPRSAVAEQTRPP